PSPLPSRVGIRIATFEACSGFTRYGPLPRSAALRRPLSQGSSPLRYQSKPPVSYSINPLTIEMESSSIDNTRRRGALGKGACAERGYWHDPSRANGVGPSAGPMTSFAHAVRPRRLTAWAKSRGVSAPRPQLRQATLPTLREANDRRRRSSVQSRQRILRGF